METIDITLGSPLHYRMATADPKTRSAYFLVAHLGVRLDEVGSLIKNIDCDEVYAIDYIDRVAHYRVIPIENDDAVKIGVIEAISTIKNPIYYRVDKNEMVRRFAFFTEGLYPKSLGEITFERIRCQFETNLAEIRGLDKNEVDFVMGHKYKSPDEVLEYMINHKRSEYSYFEDC